MSPKFSFKLQIKYQSNIAMYKKVAQLRASYTVLLDIK